MAWTDWIGRNAKTLGDIGTVAAGTVAGRAGGRADEADTLAAQDRLNQTRAISNVNLDSTRLSQALRLALLGGVQDATITPPAHIAARMPTLTGGLKPSALAGRADIVAAMQPRLLQSLMSGDHLPPVSAIPEAGALDKTLSGVGQATAFLPSVLKLLGKGGSVAAPAAMAAGGVPIAASSSLFANAIPGSSLAAGYGGGGSAAGAAGGGLGLGATGAATLGIGAAVGAAILAWQKNRNSTKNAREDFSHRLGLKNTEDLYAKLAAMGPEGQALAHEGLNVIGKKDDAANKAWMQKVATLFPHAQPQPSGFGGF